ncbi:MAG TPA: adenosylcobinamide-GDP ribazoletransferase [Acidimicrobiales bacterium]|nr:adenosylcobinamide-GDP ribazoletransferase [Acidimicrobiales bacterium]
MRSALSFLTVVGGSRRPGPATLDWFPGVGLLLGLATGGSWWLASRIWPAAVAAAVAVAVDLALTGLLHFDGVVDTADGLLPPMDRSRRLEVMSKPDAGAFGVVVAAVMLLLRWTALSAVKPDVLLLAGLWCLSRTIAAAAARSQPYARAVAGVPGLADAFAGPARWPVTGLGAAVSVALLMVWRPGPGAASAAAAIGAAVLIHALSRRRLGGYTGDVLGAGIVLAETAGLLTAAAQW